MGGRLGGGWVRVGEGGGGSGVINMMWKLLYGSIYLILCVKINHSSFVGEQIMNI